MNNPLIDKIKRLEKRLNNITNLSRRSEITGGFIRRTAAELAALTAYNGMVAYCTDGRKSGEGAGNGTGVPVYYDETTGDWLVFRDGTAVTT